MKTRSKIFSVLWIASVFAFFCCSNGNDDESNYLPNLIIKPSVPSDSVAKKLTVGLKDILIENEKIISVETSFVIEDFITLDNKVYHPEMAKFASILASSIYSSVNIKNINGREIPDDNKEKLYEELSMSDIKTEVITDVTKAIFSHREISSNGKDYSIVLVTLEGTNGTFEQWESNFDVGADTDTYYSICGNNSYWKNKKNHKGFDVAANMVGEKLRGYLAEKVEPLKNEKIIFFTGHSRGAAVANILGSVYENKTDYRTFAYTFATPNITTDKEAAEKIKTVFNIINSDDIITVMPQNSMGFVKNGRTKNISINNHAARWKELTEKDYKSANAQSAIAENGYMSGIAGSRESLYEFSDSEDNKYTIAVNDFIGISREKVEDFLNSYRLKKYTDLAFEETDGAKRFSGKICTAYLLQIIPCIISNANNKGKAIEIATGYCPGFNGKYSSFVMGFLASAMDQGLIYSHSTSSYLLASQILE